MYSMVIFLAISYRCVIVYHAFHISSLSLMVIRNMSLTMLLKVSALSRLLSFLFSFQKLPTSRFFKHVNSRQNMLENEKSNYTKESLKQVVSLYFLLMVSCYSLQVFESTVFPADPTYFNNHKKYDKGNGRISQQVIVPFCVCTVLVIVF